MTGEAAPSGRATRDTLLPAALLLVCLVPFADKPLHIDDPVYVRVARQILASPADFHGFEMNWHGQPEPVADFNKNPPGVGFYLAAAGAVFGFGERALHGAMGLAALAALLATLGLARRTSASPRAAALVMITFPAFLVSTTTLMADVLMLALWCGALLLWTDGLERQSVGRLLAAGVLAGLCVLTKYVGVALLPLLAVWGLAQRPRDVRWPLCLLLPIAIVAAYDAYVRATYGESPFAHVGAYALSYRPDALGPLEKGAIGLSFFGGCLLTGVFLAPLLWSARALDIGSALILSLLAACLLRVDALGSLALRGPEGIRWVPVVQLGLFLAGGLQWLALAGAELWRRRDGVAWLLSLWLLGIFVFATFVNWSTNARAVLPAAPAAALLVVRRLELRFGAGAPDARPWLLAPLLPALAVAWLVAAADADLAGSARRAAVEIFQRHAPAEGTVWFRGAWGFQHYAEAAGMRKIDERDTLLLPGSVVVLPTNNSNVTPVAPQAVRLLERTEHPAALPVATMAQSLGAGFYSDLWGPLPFAFGPAPPQFYYVVRVERPVRLRTEPPGERSGPGGSSEGN